MKIYFNQKINNLNFNSKRNDLYKDFLPIKPSIPTDVYISNQQNSIDLAIKQLENLEFYKSDVEKLKKLGINLIFKNGKKAVDFAKQSKIPIVFDKVDKDDIHAQWVDARKTIVINERYKDTNNLAEIYAISAAILHELSHAKDNDGYSSIQEELECLGMNALAFNVYKTQHPNLFNKGISPIIDDGVGLYTELFLGNDKKALMDRIKLKYGNLLLESPNHSAGAFAKEIKPQ
ncbi:MAG: hypothetical protein MJ180_02780 [Candidatus Gastranaerophilales bacterium]|nr:hypothetical protein [Candidatus Gastranaerophilales bacterium]